MYLASFIRRNYRIVGTLMVIKVRDGISTFPSHLANWDRAIIPIHVDGNHWTLAIAVRSAFRIYYYDTLGSSRNQSIEEKLKLITSLLGCERMTIEYPVCGIDYVSQRETVLWTCGPHVCILGEKLMKGNETFFMNCKIF